MTTLQKDHLETPAASQRFGDRAAKDIFRYQQFQGPDGKRYSVENVYVKYGQARIAVGYVYFPGMGSAPGWFEPRDGFIWDENSFGEGQTILMPNGQTALIESIGPNRACCCLSDGQRFHFREDDLRPVLNPV